jgi:hypothetical protein
LFFFSLDLLVPGCRIEIGLAAPFWNLARKSSSRLSKLPNGVEQLKVLIEIRLELNVLETFFGLNRVETFLVRLEMRDVVFWWDDVFNSPSFVPITDPLMTRLPETEVPVGDDPERLFPDDPGLNLGGGGGGGFSDRRELGSIL